MPSRYTIPSEELKKKFEQRRGFLRNLCDIINAEHTFNFDDWQILFYTLENYQPDFVFELGRGEGNSTTVIQDYCLRHKNVSFLSVDLYNTWGQEVVKRLPSDLPEHFFSHDFKHMNYIDFNDDEIIQKEWNKCLIFWDVNDEVVSKKITDMLLSNLIGRNVLICMHDVSLFSGRPKRTLWKVYESLFSDLQFAGKFIDENGCRFGMPDQEKIFGHYRNCGHWLLFEIIVEVQ